MEFKKFETKDFTENPFDILDKEWMLLSAGKPSDYNTMTASWGGFGFIWAKPVAMAVVRHSRYTLEFMEKYEHFTYSFFPREYREVLNFCGKKSGRDVDKAKETGITAISIPGIDAVTFQEARLTFVIRKVLTQDLTEPTFFDKEIFAQNYATGDIHKLFIGVIEQISI